MLGFLGYVVDFLPFVILGVHFADKWYLAHGKLWQVYILTIIGSVSTVVYNYVLWTEMQGNHRSILVFSINSAWTITMAVKGIIRLVKETQPKRLPSVPMTPMASPAKFSEENYEKGKT